ncbi:FapA family protein [Paenibacillus hunanensis]|uniref:Uncharacterized protein (DUF342 family) n=1 Tax=Paenibacillus hunanensis TaxID=539262 RepID=A0ABU1J5W3_9BACL|nr:FapA family protein [Paenibacillus hunanensis]MDR6245967.1 uncharacterized protein (DUF342 family) [Paenibacillus hunanensis]GGJ25810.1 hypothetical protein GCM10008022_38270 [Paenibacillus hunanensis]
MSRPISDEELGRMIQNADVNDIDSQRRQPNEQSFVDGKDGWIKIKDNKIHVFSPKSGGRMASIHALPPVSLIVNQNIISGKANVSEEDTVSWELEHTPMFEISVSPDQMEAYLNLHTRERFEWNLVDAPASSAVTVRAVPNRDRVVDTVQFKHVINALEHRGIYKNIDKAAILNELESPTHQPIVIARGQASVPGTDARLELFFPEQIETIFHEAGGVVDYRSHRRIPSVHEGEVIATKHEPVEGIPGFDVFGNELLPRVAQDLEVTAGEFTEMNPLGQIVALRPGRPRMTGKGNRRQIDISNAFIVDGNVDLRTGNIVFAGDVIVNGDVQEHMIIESLGNVYVHGNVYNATITATGSISIDGTIISGKIYSGYFGVMFNRMYAASKQLSHEIRQLDMAAYKLAEEVAARQQTVRYSQMIMLLIERKFRNVPELARELLQVFASIQHVESRESEQLKELLHHFLNSTTILERLDEEKLSAARTLLEGLYASVCSMQEVEVHVELARCQSSEIKSNGDIMITREGVVQSDLYSAGSIAFLLENSVCRGSRLQAEDRIVAGMVGSDANARCVLEAKQHVYVRKLYNGYIIIGDHRHHVFETMKDQLFDAEFMKSRQALHPSVSGRA